MRDFRAAPAKILRRVARTGAKLYIGEFVVSVQDGEGSEPSPLYGAMAGTGRVIGSPLNLLSSDDVWTSDGEAE
jgi:hypothetical protein